MNCEVIRDLLPLYTDGLTSPKTNQLIEEHLLSCPECSAVLEHLRMPIESPPPEDDCDKLMKALHKRKRRNRMITISICILVPLVILLAWWIRMETRYPAYQIEVDSTDPALILEEEPRVAVTAADIELAAALFTHPAILAEFASLDPNTDFTEVSPALVEDVLNKHLPEHARVSEILLSLNHIMLVYYCDETRFFLEMDDGDGTGNVDVISKTVTTPEENGDIKYMYNCICQVATDASRYERWNHHRQWFGFWG